MKKKIFTTFILSALILLTLGAVAYAYEIPDEYKPINAPFAESTDQLATDSASRTVVLLQILAGGLLYLAAPVAIIMIAQGGFNLVTGGADSEKLDQAKKHLTWSILGLALVILSYSIVRAIIRAAITAAEMGSPTTPAS